MSQCLAFAQVPGVNLAATASLAIASLDLLLVQDLIGAIRAADAETAQSASSSPLSPVPAPAPRQQVCCDPICEPAAAPQRVVHPSPCYELRFQPQPMLHALPRLALSPATGIGYATGCEAGGRETKSPVQPPWAVQRWQESVKPAAQVKVVVFRTDILSKGSLIDMFI